jgi:predicted ABC-type ATPase
MSGRPIYVVFAGVNGAGKSTLYHTDMWQQAGFPKRMARVNPDEIVREQGGDWSSQVDQMRAAREAICRKKDFLARGVSFSQETTLSGRRALIELAHAKARGFRVIMFYVGLDDPLIAQQRIAERVERGGHGIAPELLHRRFRRSLENLICARELCDEIHLFDNTRMLIHGCLIHKGILYQYGHVEPSSWLTPVIATLSGEG